MNPLPPVIPPHSPIRTAHKPSRSWLLVHRSWIGPPQRSHCSPHTSEVGQVSLLYGHVSSRLRTMKIVPGEGICPEEGFCPEERQATRAQRRVKGLCLHSTAQELTQLSPNFSVVLPFPSSQLYASSAVILSNAGLLSSAFFRLFVRIPQFNEQTRAFGCGRGTVADI